VEQLNLKQEIINCRTEIHPLKARAARN